MQVEVFAGGQVSDTASHKGTQELGQDEDTDIGGRDRYAALPHGHPVQGDARIEPMVDHPCQGDRRVEVASGPPAHIDTDIDGKPPAQGRVDPVAPEGGALGQ